MWAHVIEMAIGGSIEKKPADIRIAERGTQYHLHSRPPSLGFMNTERVRQK
jgi:hypothetical protein